MQLNSKGKLATFYLFFDSDELPRDLCTYFWGLVWRVFKCLFFGALCVGGLFGLGIMLTRFAVWIWAHRTPALVTLVGALLTSGAMLYSKRRKKVKHEVFRDIGAVINGKIDAVKNRYCPRIDWIEGSSPERD